MHPAKDAAPSGLRAVEFTPGGDGYGPVLPERLDPIPEGKEIGTLTAERPMTPDDPA